MISSEGLGPRRNCQLVEMRVFASTDNGMTYPAEFELERWRIFPLATCRLYWGKA